MELNRHMIDAMADATAIGVYEIVRDLVVQDPEMSGRDVVDLLAAQAAYVRGQLPSPEPPAPVCVNCGEQILQPSGRGWFHPGRVFETSCFEASRRRGERADLRLDPEWVASPA